MKPNKVMKVSPTRTKSVSFDGRLRWRFIVRRKEGMVTKCWFNSALDRIKKFNLYRPQIRRFQTMQRATKKNQGHLHEFF